jgi:hypothetical protein
MDNPLAIAAWIAYDRSLCGSQQVDFSGCCEAHNLENYVI